MSKALLALDTDHIKQYVFGTSKLKEIRGASSILDYLNRTQMVKMAEADAFKAKKIFANGGSALFLIDADKAEPLGKEIQKLYNEQTGGGASITYAVQPIPEYDEQKDLMGVKALSGGVTMAQVLKLLRIRLRLAKDTQQKNSLVSLASQPESEGDNEDYIVLPSHVLLAPCNSCGMSYAEGTWPDPDDPEDAENRYCRVCIKKREENRNIKKQLQKGKPSGTLWGQIWQTLNEGNNYELPLKLIPPKDFHAFRDLATQKGYLGLIYADGNGMGKAIEEKETLQEVQKFANLVDDAVFAAMGDAIKAYLPVQGNALPFDILMIGGDDIVMVTPAEKALHVAYTLAERFHVHTNQEYTLSVGVLLAPISYPFRLQHELVEETLKAAKKSGAIQLAAETNKAAQKSGAAQSTEQENTREQSKINFVVVTGNTSLSYKDIVFAMHREKNKNKEEFYATLRPYTLEQFKLLLEQLKNGNEKHLGRTKLHQLREAILKRNRTTTILESLALLRNWKKNERDFIKDLVKAFDNRSVQQQQQETLFPWYRDIHKNNSEDATYCTPLLDFIELYDFVSSDLVSFK